jgi:hypothetical protein
MGHDEKKRDSSVCQFPYFRRYTYPVYFSRTHHSISINFWHSKFISCTSKLVEQGIFYTDECFLFNSLRYKLEKTACAMHQHEGIKIELLLSHPIEKPRYLLAPLVPCFLSSIIMSNGTGII